MTLLIIGPTERVIDLLGLARYDEHVKAWRWEREYRHAAYSLHVLDWNLYHAVRPSTGAQL